MTLKTGREFLAIPGPTNIPEEVLRAMHRPAIEIYSGELAGITDSCLADLKKVFATNGRTYIYISNGHGAWEAALTNTLSRGDRILVLQSGRFAVGWGEMASQLGIEVEILEQDERKAVDPAAVEARLKAPGGKDFKAVLVVQIDTASGVVNDVAAIRKAIDAAGSDALYMVDTIASLGTMPFNMDAWGVDVAVTGSQKGLMCPPGLSFIAASPKADEAHKSADLRTRYWDWTARQGEMHYMKYCGTPPVHLLFGLRKAMDMLLEEGLESVFRRHRLLAGATHSAVEVWGQDGMLEFNIANPADRACSVTPVLVRDAGLVPKLLPWCQQNAGTVLGVGIGEFTGRAFRIAHMGYVNAPMILGTLSVIEMGLKAVGVPHQSGGVQAAIDYLADAVGV
jgi:alanine-glyoxylate transaminase/serine-glyoxylate transaminase/serine-pyruvate transaminase